MEGNANKPTHSRALWLSVLGVLVAGAGAALAYYGWDNHSTTASLGDTYQYNIAQKASAQVTYQDNSFFGNKPEPTSTAYVSDLTKDLTANFNYNFSANQSAELTSTYSITAQVKANYALKGNSEESSNVWQQTYKLVEPVTSKITGNTVAINKTITIPYAEYKQTASDFRIALTLPTSSEVVVTFTATTKGTVNGLPFDDTRVSTVTAPLEDQLFQPKVQFDKEDSKQVMSEDTKHGQANISRAQVIGGILLIIAGGALVMFGLRKRIFKSAYQRELDKIYRYHDGLIVRTSRPIDLTDHQVIPMRSFDDMLNLEEELKKPIIADEISSTLTHFLIASSNVLYLYKLSAEPTSSRAAEQKAPAPKTAPAPKPTPEAPAQKVYTYGLAPAMSAKPSTDGMRSAPKRPLGSHTKKVTVAKESNDLDDIISELAKKPSKKK